MCRSLLFRVVGATWISFFFSVPASVAQTVPSGFNDAVVISGFNAPVGFTFDANGRMYVWEKSGTVWIVDNGTRLPVPLIDLSEEVGNWRDHGCLGFTLDPAFLSNGRIYLFYTVDRNYLMNYGQPGYDPDADQYLSATIMRVTRYTAIGPAFTSQEPEGALRRTFASVEAQFRDADLAFSFIASAQLIACSQAVCRHSSRRPTD